MSEISSFVAVPISRFGKDFKIPTMKDLVKLKEKINIPAIYATFVTMSNIIDWCCSPEGVDPFLQICGKLNQKELEALAPDYQRYLLAQEIIVRMMNLGAPKSESETLIAEAGEKEAPLAQATNPNGQ
jgi:hypothetical protein